MMPAEPLRFIAADSGARNTPGYHVATPAVHRNERLDMLRAIAVLLVMSWHMALPSADSHPLTSAIIAFLRRPGWVGVDLFFVLSGFLVSGLLFREFRLHGNLQPLRFLVRRGFKIYPAFYLYLVLTFSFGVYPTRVPSWNEFLLHAAFLQSYVARAPGIWVHTWSLAVEEHFYILLAIAMALLLRRGRAMLVLRQALVAFVTAAGAVLIMRIATVVALLRGNTPFYAVQDRFFATHLRLDALLFGVFLAYLFHEQPNIWNRLAQSRRLILGVSAVLLLPAFVFHHDHPFTASVGYTLYYLGFGGLLIFALSGRRQVRPAWHWESALAAIGAYSYSIYLWHVAVKRWGTQAFQHLSGVQMSYAQSTLLYFAGTIVLGVAMAKIVEIPFLRLRDKHFPSRSMLAAAPLRADPTLTMGTQGPRPSHPDGIAL